ncbi:hypothetical protein F5Y17DRAFT_338532 [Xylariaceae sp. FL0594]|nr:hypothetical protein F5Y17DRAFT_338532 [Xylariaceae sp. FL0594]
MARIHLSKPLLHQLRLPYLLIPPALLFVGAVLTLLFHGDVNATLLYSQCHARSRLPGLSRVPVLGAPACFLVSFFSLAAASTRAVAQMSAVLAFVAALLTVSLVEAARPCNRPSRTVRSPALAWLVTNLGAGALAWDVWIVPEYLRRAKRVVVERAKQDALRAFGAVEAGEGGGTVGGLDPEERVRIERSFITSAEVYAIPVSVLVGFIVPSILMLFLSDAAGVVVVVAVWLFYPVWVALIRWLVELAAVRFVLRDNGPLHLESSAPSVVLVYAVPFLCSLFAHGFLIFNVLFSRDDSREMTRMALRYVAINFAYLAATVLYWVFVEAGPVPAVVLVASSLIFGPGAALCIAWSVREKVICAGILDEGEEDGTMLGDEEEDDDDDDASTVHENTPLLS